MIENLTGLIIEGKRMEHCFINGDFKLPFFSTTTETENIVGRRGSVMIGRSTEELRFTIPMTFYNKDLKFTKNDIMNHIVKSIDEEQYDSDEFEGRIQIEGEDWFWYGRIDGVVEIGFFDRVYFNFDLNIVLSDPHRYDTDLLINTASGDGVTVINNGTAETPFVAEFTALENASYLTLTDVESNHFMIGEDNEDITIKNYSPAILRDEFRSTNTYSRMSANENIPDRYLGGSTGAKFIQTITSWGLDLDSVPDIRGWRGGALSRSFNRSVQNFKSTFKVNINHRDIGSGKIGQFIYDENGRLLFSLGYQNVHSSQDSGRILFMAYNEQGDERLLWGPKLNNKLKRVPILTIYFELIRKDKQIKMRYWCYDDTNPNGRKKHLILTQDKRIFNDNGLIYQRKIANTRFGLFRGNGRYRRMSALGVYMYELLNKPPGAKDMFIKAGDTIILDTYDNGEIIVNGTPMKDKISMSSSFFKIQPGLTNLLISPENTFDTVIKWRNRFK